MQASWWVQLAVRPGCLDGFAKLTCEMVSSAQAEDSVLAYRRFISEDRQTVTCTSGTNIPTRRQRISV